MGIMPKCFYPNRKVVILTGAGAAIPWDAPTTDELTQLLVDDTDFVTPNETSVARFISERLNDFYDKESDVVNFEDIINFLEIIFDYTNSLHTTGFKEFKSELSVIFDPVQEIDINLLNEEYIKEQDEQLRRMAEGYTTLENPNINGIYIREIITYYLNLLIHDINRYCNDIDDFSELNDKLRDFFKYFIDKNYCVRYYTVNYDQLPIICCPTIEFFDGFDIPSSNGNEKQNIEKIISNDIVNCHYNLHGSIYFTPSLYEWERADRFQPIPTGTSQDHTQSGKALLKTNILTGLDKSSRMFYSPHIQFYNSFARDCFNADIIITIGYSFSDIHLNRAIKNKAQINNRTSFYDITLFDPINGEPNWFELQEEYEIFWNDALEDNFTPNQNLDEHNNDWIISEMGNKRIYWRGFDEFLLNDEWEYINI